MSDDGTGRCTECGHKLLTNCECATVSDSPGLVGYDAKLQDEFGFNDGITKCHGCGVTLNRENAYWAFGEWWHRMVKDCQVNKA